MRKTRLVILPTKCLHQMGFLLLFLSCPVIGDWGRIRPESENLHKAIQMDREGTCGLQRDPPGELINFPNENRSDQCRLSEDFDLSTITKKPIFRNIRSDERRVDLQSIHQRNTRASERSRATDRRSVQKAESRLLDEKKDTRRESQRRIDERRIVKKEPERRTVDERREIRRTLQKNLRRDVREPSQPRTRVTGYIPSSLRQPENEQAFKRQRLAHARNVRNDNKIETRNEREESQQTRRIFEKPIEKEIAGRRPLKEQANDLRENEMRIRNAQVTKERQNQRVVRSAEREKKDIRRDDQRSVRERSLRRRENVTVRQTQERSQERQTERLSMARREQNKEITKSENERHIERSESALSRIRKSRSLENLNDAFERKHKETKRLDIRRNTENGRIVNPFTKTNQRELKRERRVELLNDKTDRIMEMKTERINDSAKNQNLPEDEKNGKEENISEEITKWMNLKRFESLKVGDWTTNCVVGAVVYFLSAKHIKAV